MRILRVAQKIYPEVTGGGAYHAHAMSRDQVELGHEVTVLTVRRNPDMPHVEDRDGYTVVRYDPTATFLGNDISAGIAQYLYTADGFDVLHAHSHLYFSTNLAALKRVTGSPPLAITNHGLYSQTVPKSVFDAYLHTAGRWTFNLADTVFTYSESERQELRDIGVTGDITVIQNGIDTERFSPRGATDERIESPAVLLVGRLVDGKRPVDAVRVLTKVREMGIDATLYVAGTGPLESKMESVASTAGVADSLVFLGHVPYEGMPALYRSTDVLTLPSRNEGLPRTVLEALAVGTPVVASALDQLEPVVDSNSQTVPVGNIDAFAASIVQRLESFDRGERLLPPGYEWATTVEETTQRLHTLTKGSV